VEGEKANVLEGASRLLGLPKIYWIYWIVEVHSQELENKCLQIFDSFGYMTIIIPQAWWRFFIPELRSSSHNRWLFAMKR
jgi:hypothetical protein